MSEAAIIQSAESSNYIEGAKPSADAQAGVGALKHPQAETAAKLDALLRLLDGAFKGELLLRP